MESKFFKAKTHHVNNAVSVDMMMDLGFSVLTIVPVKLKGVDLPFIEAEDDESKKKSDAARYCLIILIGGKKLLLQVDDDEKRRPSGIMLLKGKSSVEECKVSYNGADYINVNRYMMWLNEHGFDPSVVKAHLNRYGSKFEGEEK